MTALPSAPFAFAAPTALPSASFSTNRTDATFALSDTSKSMPTSHAPSFLRGVTHTPVPFDVGRKCLSGQEKQVHSPVKSAVEGEVRHGRVYRVVRRIVHRDLELRFLPELAGELRPKCRVAPFVSAQADAVEEDFRHGICREDFKIAHSLFGRERLGIDAFGAQISVRAVLTVGAVPSVRQIYAETFSVKLQLPIGVQTYSFHIPPVHAYSRFLMEKVYNVKWTSFNPQILLPTPKRAFSTRNASHMTRYAMLDRVYCPSRGGERCSGRALFFLSEKSSSPAFVSLTAAQILRYHSVTATG